MRPDLELSKALQSLQRFAPASGPNLSDMALRAIRLPRSSSTQAMLRPWLGVSGPPLHYYGTRGLSPTGRRSLIAMRAAFDPKFHSLKGWLILERQRSVSLIEQVRKARSCHKRRPTSALVQTRSLSDKFDALVSIVIRTSS